MDDIVAELEESKERCNVLRADDFYDLKQYKYNKYHQWLREIRGITTREEEDKILSGVAVWCNIMLEQGIDPENIARHAVLFVKELLTGYGGLAQHEKMLAGDVNLISVPPRSHLRLLFAKALVDLCFVRGHISYQNGGELNERPKNRQERENDTI